MYTYILPVNNPCALHLLIGVLRFQLDMMPQSICQCYLCFSAFRLLFSSMLRFSRCKRFAPTLFQHSQNSTILLFLRRAIAKSLLPPIQLSLCSLVLFLHCLFASHTYFGTLIHLFADNLREVVWSTYAACYPTAFQIFSIWVQNRMSHSVAKPIAIAPSLKKLSLNSLLNFPCFCFLINTFISDF